MSDAPVPGRAAVRVTIGQLDVGADRAANLAAAEDVLRAAGVDGAAFAVLPEYASQYDPRGVGIEHAEPLDGPWVTGLREAAARNGVAVFAGVTVPDTDRVSDAVPDSDAVRGLDAPSGAAPGPDGGAAAGGDPGRPRARNVVVAIGADGALLGTYTKVHLYDAFGMRESDKFEAGDPAAPPLVVDVGGLRVGVVTCYDLRFPESTRRAVLAGADAVVVPAAWVSGPGKAEQWRALLVARAIENGAFVVGVGQVGRGRTGGSLLADPNGEVRAEMLGGPGVVTVEIDPGLVDAVRERNPVLELRRYDVVPRGR